MGEQRVNGTVGRRAGLRHLLRAASLGAVVALGAAVAGGTGSVSAPEPARLSAYLGGSTGATGAAVFVNTSAPTTVLLWPGTWTSGSAAAGTPCSTVALVPGTIATKTIQVSGAYRRCA